MSIYANALAPAEGPALDTTMQALLGSADPFRQQAGLRAAAQGRGMPAALPLVIEAAADPDLSLDAARRAVVAIERALPGAAAPVLVELARDESASADASAEISPSRWARIHSRRASQRAMTSSVVNPRAEPISG